MSITLVTNLKNIHDYEICCSFAEISTLYLRSICSAYVAIINIYLWWCCGYDDASQGTACLE